MQLFNIDPVQAAVFVFGLVIAWLVVRLIKSRRTSSHAPARRQAGGIGNWLPAAVALVLLLAVWIYLR